MKKLMMVVTMMMVMMVTVIPVKAEQADGIKPEEATMATEPEEIDYFKEICSEIDWQIENMEEDGETSSVSRSIDYENQTASWHVNLKNGEYVKADIHDGMIWIEGKEQGLTMTATATLEDYYNYSIG